MDAYERFDCISSNGSRFYHQKSYVYLQKDTDVSMNVKAAWQAGYTGKGILVAVVDDGVRIDHPDLKPKIVSPRL